MPLELADSRPFIKDLSTELREIQSLVWMSSLHVVTVFMKTLKTVSASVSHKMPELESAVLCVDPQFHSRLPAFKSLEKFLGL